MGHTVDSNHTIELLSDVAVAIVGEKSRLSSKPLNERNGLVTAETVELGCDLAYSADVKTLTVIACLLSAACAVVLAQQQPAAATMRRTTIDANVAAGLLCGSSEPATAKDDQKNAPQHVRADTFCGPVPPPLYPAAAKQQGIQGTVLLKAVIGADGTVRELRVIDGHPLLAPAAVEAVKRWKYKPYYVKGKPVEVETTVTVSFRLEKQ